MSYLNFTRPIVIAATFTACAAQAQVVEAILGANVIVQMSKQEELNSKGEKPTGDVITANYRKGQAVGNFQDANDFCRAQFAQEHPQADHSKVHITLRKSFFSITCEMVAPKLLEVSK